MHVGPTRCQCGAALRERWPSQSGPHGRAAVVIHALLSSRRCPTAALAADAVAFEDAPDARGQLSEGAGANRPLLAKDALHPGQVVLRAGVQANYGDAAGPH